MKPLPCGFQPFIVVMAAQRSEPLLFYSRYPEETNILTDGCLIDLCGVTLIWRTAMGLEQAPVCDMKFIDLEDFHTPL